MQTSHSTRVVSGVLAVLGALSILAYLVIALLEKHWPPITSLILVGIVVPFGVYIFGVIAMTGNLPKIFKS